MINFRPLVIEILKQYQLPWYSTHGLPHWGRVLENGLRIAEHSTETVDEDIITLFAFFHDSCRINESIDPGHGDRGAQLAKKFRNRFFKISDYKFNLLLDACRFHTSLMHPHNPILQTCFDADRLDLSRVAITPDPDLLNTEFAKSSKTIKWANQRAQRDIIVPKIKPIMNAMAPNSYK